MWKSCHTEAQGASGGLITLRNATIVQMESISNTPHWKLLRVTYFDLTFLLVNVYAPNSTIGKQRLWKELDFIFEQSGLEKVALVGDFNAILSPQEKEELYHPKRLWMTLIVLCTIMYFLMCN